MWHESSHRNGVAIHARFFDGDVMDLLPDAIERSLCFLPGTRARMLWSENDRHNVRWGQLVAQSDALFDLGNGLLSLEYKTRGKRSLDRNDWLKDVRLKDMLQCVIAAVAVAQTTGKTCAAVLRYHNVGLLLVPEQRLLDLIFGMVPAACQYFGRSDVRSSALAHYTEARVVEEFPWRDEVRSQEGVKAHREMFR
jgi:hypothetical protein